MKTHPVQIFIPLMILGFLGTCPMPARAGGRHVLTLSANPRAALRSDALLSPRLQRGLGLLAFRFGYTYEGERYDNLAELEFGLGRSRSAPAFEIIEPLSEAAGESASSGFTTVRARYGVLVPAWAGDRLTLRLGGGLDLDFQEIDPKLGAAGRGTTLGVFSADLLAELAFQPTPRHGLSLSAALPALAWVSHSPSGPSDQSPFETFARTFGEGRPETWNPHQAVRLRAVHLWQPTPRWGVVTSLELRVLRERDPRPLLLREFGLGVGVQATF